MKVYCNECIFFKYNVGSMGYCIYNGNNLKSNKNNNCKGYIKK